MVRERCLLFVDDEKALCEMIEGRYSRRGWRVLTAQDGAVGLKIFERYSAEVTVVVSDLNQPGLRGEDLLKIIRQRNSGLPLIAISGEPDLKKRLGDISPGVDFYLKKRFDMEMMDLLLENSHRLYQLRLDLQEERAKEASAARLFRQFVVSDSPHQIVSSRRGMAGSVALEIASHTFETTKPGGDYVEWFSRGSEEVLFCVSDAAGHGELTCTLMACLTTIILHRSHHWGRLGVEELASIVDETFLRLKSQGGIEGKKFMCLFLGAISLLTGRMVYVNAGHTDGLLVKASGGKDGYAVSRLPVHVPAPAVIPESLRAARPFSEQSTRLSPGDLLVIYTDGASDFLGGGSPKTGMDRFEQAVLDLHQPSAVGTVEKLVGRLNALAGPEGLEDDATLLVIRVLGNEEAQAASFRAAAGG